MTNGVSELEVIMSAREPAALVDAILGYTPSGAVIARVPDGKIIRFSDQAARILGRSRSDFEGHLIKDVLEHLAFFDVESNRRLSPHELPLSKALAGDTIDAFEYRVEAASGELIPCISSAAPIPNWAGTPIGAISSFADLRQYKSLESGLRDALARRETLYRELTHRVKNHLQIMSGLVAIGARDPGLSTKNFAEQVMGHLRALGAVYRGMDRAEVGEAIQACTFVEDICSTYSTHLVNVEAEIEPTELTLAPEQAGPIGMLLNEAICNSCKHAFPEQSGRICVALRASEPGRLCLEVNDDGVGWGPLGPSETHHGLKLMQLFARQLHGDLKLGANGLGGALVKVEMPRPIA